MSHHILRRAATTTAAAAALGLATASMASAHHCYKVDWNERAYAQLSQGGTPWMSLTTLGGMIIAEDIGMPECAGYASVAIDHWMAETGATSVPLIHSKATVGGGALHNNPQGRTPKAINFLGEADFPILDEGLGMAIAQCQADQAS